MTNDRPLLGIALMSAFCVLIPFGDAIAKMLGESIPIIQLLLVRYVFQMVIMVPLVLLTGQTLRMPVHILWLVIMRSSLLILGMAMMFTSLRFLPLADTVAIAFVMPLIMLVLGKYVLKETVGQFRLGVSLVGFCGTLLIVQPSFATVGWPAMLPLGVAFSYAFFILVTRKIGHEIGAMPLQAMTGTLCAIFVIAALALTYDRGIVEMALVWPSRFEAGMFVIVGILGTFAHLLMTWSLRYAPSTTLAPLQYIEMPVATALGWLFFGDLPNGLAAVGIAITVAAGLAIIMRERFIAKGLTAA